jgi:hypothetical protein
MDPVQFFPFENPPVSQSSPLPAVYVLTARAVGVVLHVFCSLENKIFLRETRDASGRLQRRGAVKGERSEFISTLDGEHR